MRLWYSPYLEVYERDVHILSPVTIQHVKLLLQPFKQEKPLLSIVVIAYNEEQRLLSCLWSLSQQVCSEPMELIVVNNNSTDQTEDVLQMLDVKYYNEDKQGPGYARQRGLEEASGKYVICIDADTMYPPYYVQTHFDALQKAGVSCAFSLWSFLPRSGQSSISLFIYEWLRDLYLNLQFIKRPELCVRGMVFSFRTDLARQVGFRTDIKRGEDGSLALGLKKYGKIVFVRDRKARAITGYGTLNADGSLFKSFTYRLWKAMKGLPGLFSRKAQYKDEETNLIDKPNN